MRNPSETHRGERGAAATLVAVLAAGGVLMGMLALTVDVGNMMFERRQLQNGADATAMALAQACAKTPAALECAPTPGAGLKALNSANAPSDGQHGFYTLRADAPAGICGRGVAGLKTCASDGSDATIQDLPQCPALPGWMKSGSGKNTKYVETYTRSQSSSGPLLDFFFDNGNATVVSCARAAWGNPGSTGPTFPLTIKECHFNLALSNAGGYAPSPPYSPPPGTGSSNPSTNVPGIVAPYVTHIIASASSNPKIDCNDGLGQSMYAPGGFGWLDVSSGCIAEFDATAKVGGDPGASPPGDCSDEMVKWLGKEVQVPVFSDASGTGSNTEYQLAGVASFYLAGWHGIPSAKPDKDYGIYKMPNSLPKFPGNTFCRVRNESSGNLQDGTCIWGWFTSPLLPVGTISPSVPGRGPTVIQMTG